MSSNPIKRVGDLGESFVGGVGDAMGGLWGGLSNGFGAGVYFKRAKEKAEELFKGDEPLAPGKPLKMKSRAKVQQNILKDQLNSVAKMRDQTLGTGLGTGANPAVSVSSLFGV